MITVEELKTKSLNQYKTYLKYLVEKLQSQSDEVIYCENDSTLKHFFPLFIRCNTGNAKDDIRTRAKQLEPLFNNCKNKTGESYTLELETRNTRNNANQTEIKSIYFETEKDYLSFIGKTLEVKRFLAAINIIQTELIETKITSKEWPLLHITDLTNVYEKNFWEDIILCVKWLNENKNSNLYIREIPLPVHTKFIENNKTLISSLLISENKELSFEELFGIKTKPFLARVRSLCENVQLKVGSITVSELSIPLEDFKNLDKSNLLTDVENIFIVENEMVYLTFPKVENSICIWGHGFTSAQFSKCKWLQKFKLFYFGDLDEHGYLILSNFRSHFPQTISFCMDIETLEKYSEFRVKGKTLSGNAVPEHLTKEELSVFNMLHNSDGKDRLEQEKISVEYIKVRFCHKNCVNGNFGKCR